MINYTQQFSGPLWPAPLLPRAGKQPHGGRAKSETDTSERLVD